MNKNSYDKLPADVKTIFDDLVGEYKERSHLLWNAVDFVGRAYGVEKGVEFIEPSAAEIAKFKAAVEPVIQAHINKLVGKGYSQAEVEGWIKFLRERISYWTAKQIEWRIPSPTGPPEMRPEALIK